MSVPSRGLHPSAPLSHAGSGRGGCKPADGHLVCIRPRRYRSRIAASAGANQAAPPHDHAAVMCGRATIKSESRVVQLNAVAQHKRQWEAHGLAAGRRGDTDLYVGRDTGRDGLPIPTDDRRRFS
jgi:hypothetical protein